MPLPGINLNSDLMFHFNDHDRTAYELFACAPWSRQRPAEGELPDAALVQPRYTIVRAPSSGAPLFANRE